MALLTFRNALRLHLDSVLLFRKRRYASAYFLSVISLEEIGKVFFLTDFLFDSRVNGRLNPIQDPELEKMFGQNVEEGYFRKRIFNHRFKQRSFVQVFDSEFKPSNKYLKALRDGLVDAKKQDSLYVGLKRDKGSRLLNGRVSVPSKISHSTVVNQIELMHFSLLELILNVAIDSWSTDSNALDAYLTRPLYNRLKPVWPTMQVRRKRRLAVLERY